MFHVKYRPKTLKEVIGNKQIKKSLKSILKGGSLVHVFLFHGESGCGKTTFARIIKDELGCSDQDYNEINAGNNRGIDTAREILKNIHYAPMEGDCKVILLDEVHATTKDFQNALLKVLEDDIKHVYFVLCTTDPQKLLPTIRNRCASYEVEALEDKHIKKLLKRVAEKEGKELVRVVQDKLIDKSEGCPRSALVLLEQIIFMKKKDQLKAIKTFKTQEQKVIDLCRALLKKQSWSKISKIIAGIDEDPESVRRAVLGYISTVMLNGKNDHCAVIYLCFKDPFFNNGKAGLIFSAYRAINY